MAARQLDFQTLFCKVFAKIILLFQNTCDITSLKISIKKQNLGEYEYGRLNCRLKYKFRTRKYPGEFIHMYKSRRHPICIWVTKFYEHKQFQQDVLIIQSQIFTFMQYAIQAIGYLINSLHRHNTSILYTCTLGRTGFDHEF